ncbi:S9 family peptidase, partial [Leptolyngbya sp. FACHB-36]|nr:S9 family peptidase [Leptolyngbya sp. FACHB-36]
MTPSSSSLSYPKSQQSNQVDTYHGVHVSDPYRWLENPDSPETQAWIEAQNAVTFRYLNQIPVRDRLKNRLTKLWNYEKYGIPFKQGDAIAGGSQRYFYFKNDGLQNQSVLYTLKALNDTPTVLLDPNKLSEDGTIALSGLT